ncbi:MAG TPA: 30S ribosome-binding factor RbfA [Phycisphaerales bacterium]|nr:30S ribosome-binding factor RbfA [Phycisphaerales bacterium]
MTTPHSSHRMEKVESTIARAVQQVIARGLQDPRAGGLISVVRVDVSPDMATAMVFISVYPEEKQELSMHALRHAAKHIRREASELMAIRKMPSLDFRLDLSLKRQAEVFDALAKARQSTPVDTAPTSDSANTSPAPERDPPAPLGTADGPATEGP